MLEIALDDLPRPDVTLRLPMTVTPLLLGVTSLCQRSASFAGKCSSVKGANCCRIIKELCAIKLLQSHGKLEEKAPKGTTKSDVAIFSDLVHNHTIYCTVWWRRGGMCAVVGHNLDTEIGIKKVSHGFQTWDMFDRS